MDVKQAIQILGIDVGEDSRLLTVAKIRKHYLRAALQTHPDKKQNSKNSSEDFIKLQEAYRILLQHSNLDDDNDQLEQNDPSLNDDEINAIVKLAFQGKNIDAYIKKYNIYQPHPMFGIDLTIPFHHHQAPSTHHRTHADDDMEQLFKEAFKNAGLDPDGNPLDGWARPPST